MRGRTCLAQLTPPPDVPKRVCGGGPCVVAAVFGDGGGSGESGPPLGGCHASRGPHLPLVQGGQEVLAHWRGQGVLGGGSGELGPPLRRCHASRGPHLPPAQAAPPHATPRPAPRRTAPPPAAPDILPAPLNPRQTLPYAQQTLPNRPTTPPKPSNQRPRTLSASATRSWSTTPTPSWWAPPRRTPSS